MSKVVDITDKLSFEGNPKIAISGKEYEVNADASTALKIMGILGNGEDVEVKDVIDMYELIFGEKERADIDKMKLQFSDFQTLVYSAVNLITGAEDDPEGE